MTLLSDDSDLFCGRVVVDDAFECGDEVIVGGYVAVSHQYQWSRGESRGIGWLNVGDIVAKCEATMAIECDASDGFGRSGVFDLEQNVGADSVDEVLQQLRTEQVGTHFFDDGEMLDVDVGREIPVGDKSGKAVFVLNGDDVESVGVAVDKVADVVGDGPLSAFVGRKGVDVERKYGLQSGD